ncbi:MAG TPA: ribonucleotide-diphosphate reductase subunit alpha, partial [Arthrobacter sp.]
MDTTVADTEVTGSGSAAKPASAGKTSAAVEKHTVPGEKPAMPAAYQGLGYHELNAMLNLYGPNGEIQFEADREAAHQYFLQHVNNNTVFFHDLEEKLDYLVKNEYY